MFANVSLQLYGEAMEITPSITPDAAGLKVLAHPVRLEALGMLRVEGPATATMLAQRLGLNSGATSYHLRQLAQHGFIEEDTERGNGRERWWRASHRATRTSVEGLAPDDPVHDLHGSYLHAVADVYNDKVRRALDEQSSLPQAWQDVSMISDWVLRVRPEQARALLERLVEEIQEFPETTDDDADGAAYCLQVQAFPLPGRLS
jgi:DNA-binding transcriptional ArsR family regulator